MAERNEFYLFDNAMIINYRELKSGQSKTMTRGLFRAQEHLTKYGESRNLGVNPLTRKSSWKCLTAKGLCTENFFREFGTCLVDYASKTNDYLLLSGESHWKCLKSSDLCVENFFL